MKLSKDCPECGMPNSKLAEKCRECGADLSDVPAGRH